MKFLKWLLITVLILAALVLIIPLFLPSSVSITAEEKVNVSPAQVFHATASFSNREKWDPWLTMEPGAEVNIVSEPEYVGSVYTWKGEKIGTGKMEVDSVVFGKYIASNIWFGEESQPSRVIWELEEADEGTRITWTFRSKGGYPFGRLMLTFMQGQMKSSFEEGLQMLKEELEANPPGLYNISEIEQSTLEPMHALVAPAEGTLEEIIPQMSALFSSVYTELSKQGLQVAGKGFTHYFDYDEEGETMNVLAGFQVSEPGKDAGGVMAKSYPEMDVIQVMHTGSYDYFEQSYMALQEYAGEHDLSLTNEAFEFYQVGMMEEDNPMKWKTLIAFPLK